MTTPQPRLKELYAISFYLGCIYSGDILSNLYEMSMDLIDSLSEGAYE
jgi:hypothetical protein